MEVSTIGKILKGIAVAVLATAASANALGVVTGAAVADYSASSFWVLQANLYSRKTTQQIILPNCGNGYKIFIKSKGGNCSANMIEISTSDGEHMTLTEAGEQYALYYKTDPAKDYVIFNIELKYSGGTNVYNDGAITIW